MFQIVLQFQSLEELLNYAKQSDRLSNKGQKDQLGWQITNEGMGRQATSNHSEN